MNRYISLAASPDIVEAIAQLPMSPDIRVGNVQSAESLIDAADAPMGPDEIKAVLATITLVCTTGKSMIDLLVAVKGVLTKRGAGKGSGVNVVDPRSGRVMAVVTPDTNIEQAKKELGIDDSPPAV